MADDFCVRAMPPLYYTDTCVYVGYSFMTLFLASLFSACGAACAITYVDVVPRQKTIVQLENSIEILEGEINAIHETEGQEYVRRQSVEDELAQVRRELVLAQSELRLERDDLRIAKRDNDIYATIVYSSLIFVSLYLLSFGIKSFGTSDRTEL